MTHFKFKLFSGVGQHQTSSSSIRLFKGKYPIRVGIGCIYQNEYFVQTSQCKSSFCLWRSHHFQWYSPFSCVDSLPNLGKHPKENYLFSCSPCTSNQSPFSELQWVYELLNQSYHLLNHTRIESVSETLHGWAVISLSKLKSQFPTAANIYKSNYIRNWPGITL